VESHRERFYRVMDYKPCEKIPNYELGVWGQTKEQWEKEGIRYGTFHWDWFVGEESLGMDRKEYIPLTFTLMPPFEEKVLRREGEYEMLQLADGRITRALATGTARDGTRMSMDQYLSFAVKTYEDFQELKKRLDPHAPARQMPYWRDHIECWKNRKHVLVLGENCAPGGFYWRARDYMGTEGVSFAWYDQPKLMHEMMEFYADFTMEVCRPILEEFRDIDFFNLNEDLAMKTGPLLSPATYKEFIFPHLKRMVEFFKSHGVRYFGIDTDGNAEALIPMFLDAGVDVLWPTERAADMDPARLRKKFGKSLRIWGGVDKRELAKDKKAIREHLKQFIPLLDEGGFIPTVDHTVQPGVSYDNFCYYMELKNAILQHDYSVLG